MFDVIRDSDLVILLIADAALGELADEVFAALRPGSILGLSHGYLLAHLRATGREFPARVSIVAVCPKGMGMSVRRLYEQGRDIDGAGINASVAVHADVDGRATTSRSDGRSRSAPRTSSRRHSSRVPVRHRRRAGDPARDPSRDRRGGLPADDRTG